MRHNIIIPSDRPLVGLPKAAEQGKACSTSYTDPKPSSHAPQHLKAMSMTAKVHQLSYWYQLLGQNKQELHGAALRGCASVPLSHIRHSAFWKLTEQPAPQYPCSQNSACCLIWPCCLACHQMPGPCHTCPSIAGLFYPSSPKAMLPAP